MRIMTKEEQRKFLSTAARAFGSCDFMVFDAICSGGQLEEYRDARNDIRKVIDAIPQDIRDQYDAGLRKVQADKLRKQADDIEKGKQA